jgi:hypothetical protein
LTTWYGVNFCCILLPVKIDKVAGFYAYKVLSILTFWKLKKKLSGKIAKGISVL